MKDGHDLRILVHWIGLHVQHDDDYIRAAEQIQQGRIGILAGERRRVDQLELDVLVSHHPRGWLMGSVRKGCGLRGGVGHQCHQRGFAGVGRADYDDLGCPFLFDAVRGLLLGASLLFLGLSAEFRDTLAARPSALSVPIVRA